MENIRLEVQIQEEIETLMVISEEYGKSKAAAHTIEKGLLKQLLVLKQKQVEKAITYFTNHQHKMVQEREINKSVF